MIITIVFMIIIMVMIIMTAMKMMIIKTAIILAMETMITAVIKSNLDH